MKLSKKRKIAIAGAVLAFGALVGWVLLTNPTCPGEAASTDPGEVGP